MKTRHEILMEDPEYRRLYAIEGLVADAAELVARLMEEQRVNRAELARRLGKSRAWVTQLLSGRANMTIRTFAEVVFALGAAVELNALRRTEKRASSTTRQGQTLQVRRWAIAYKMPGAATSRMGYPEFRYIHGGPPAPVWALHDQANASQRTEYAA